MNKIPFINLYPMQEEPYHESIIQQQKLAKEMGFPVEQLPPLITINNPQEHITQALHNFSKNTLPRLVEEKLKHSKEYKTACQLMPNLSDVKNITKYRKIHTNFDQQELEVELYQHGVYLPEKMVLFHGGVFPRHHANGEINTEFLTDRPLSTTLCAQVAAVHSEYHNPKEIWIIHISRDSVTKAFIFKNDSRQIHAHETEILLSAGARVTYLSSFNINNHTVYNVELC
jgi:hypothetical protein